MLILVGVTINVAMQGGIFKKGDNAAKSTQIEADKEQIQAAIVAAYEVETGKISKNELETSLGTGWTVDGTDGGIYTVTSPKGNKYTVNQKGEITPLEEESEDTQGGSDAPEVGENTENWVDNGDGTFTKGDATVEIGKTTYENAEVQEKLGATGGTYKKTWTVIGVEGDKLKLVSTEDVSGSVFLGTKDPNVYKKDAEGNITTKLKDEIVNLNGVRNLEFKKAVWSYANAVNTLNEEAKKATGIPSAESITIEDIYDIIGEDNVNKGSSYGKVYKYYFDTTKSKVCSKEKTGTDANGEEQWGSESPTSYKTQTFVDSEGRIVTKDAKNPEPPVRLTHYYFFYKLTDTQKSAIGSLATGSYWLASPCVNCCSDSAHFIVRCMNSGDMSGSKLFISSGYHDYGKIGSHGVRAVVSI